MIQPPHSPIAFDAAYALTWGSSCTGHAHAGAALFRANGIPARTLLTMPTWASNFDMHWVIDYFIPNYGWVRMETSTGQHPSPPQNEIVTLACNPEDEFPLFFPSGIEGSWHTSDPTLGMYSPHWGGAHTGLYILSVSNSQAKIDQAFALTDSVFHYYSNYWGINLSADQQTIFQNAFNYQATALSKLVASDIHGYVNNMQLALNQYKNINAAPMTTIFFDDFERNTSGWTHGGQKDEWELGFPTFQIRFRFESDPHDVQAGSYIDDFHVYGRKSGVSAVQAQKLNTSRQAFDLSQNYPNPFNSVTHINYTLPIQGKARLVLYNTLGEKICTLVDENKPPGKYAIRWNGFDNRGNSFASGMYFYQLQVATGENIIFNQTKKLILLK